MLGCDLSAVLAYRPSRDHEPAPGVKLIRISVFFVSVRGTKSRPIPVRFIHCRAVSKTLSCKDRGPSKNETVMMLFSGQAASSRSAAMGLPGNFGERSTHQ